MITPICWTLVRVQLWLCGAFCVATALWYAYRQTFTSNLQSSTGIARAELRGCQPGEQPQQPRRFVQYGYRTSLCGSLLMRSWMLLLGAGYLVVIWGCWMSYVIFADLWFPPGPEFWVETFHSWEGLMLPWCVCFSLVHFFLAVLLIFWDAMQSHAMLPVARMSAATHVIVQECPESPDSLTVEEHPSFLVVCGEYFHRLRMREVLPVLQSETGQRYVEYTCVRYVYSESQGAESCGAFVMAGHSIPEAQKMHSRLRAGGLRDQEVRSVRETCGLNSIHVPVPSRLEALTAEFGHFTYVFNSIGIWTYVAYTTWNIGLLWLLMTLGSGTYRALGITRPGQKRVSDLARMQKACVVLRDRQLQEVDVSEIVLGDIVQVQGGADAELPCDGVVISGSLIVDESMLTGEPMPIAKVPVEDAPCNHLHVKSNKAYAGTRVIESRGEKENGGLALIYCTEVGARTARGELVRMVLFPSSVKFKYTDQLPIVYAFMCLYAILAVILHLSAVDPGSGVVQYLHILCSLCGALSPMLPVSLVMGQSVSAKRLTGQEYNIKCLQPGRIPIAGKISTMVFDKTGTITKSTMDFAGVHAVRADVEAQPQSAGARFLQPLRLEALEGCERPGRPGRPETLDSDRECGKAVLESWLLGMPELLHSALAVCHTVKQLEDGSLVGNELECAMVRKMSCSIGHDTITLASGQKYEILRELQFDHRSMTSGIVVRRQGQVGEVEVFVKGSPEKIRALARPSSLPPNYDQTVMQHAKANYYTISICHKSLRASDEQVGELPRGDLEQNVALCGLLLFKNEMKSEAPEAIQQLKDGAVRSVICTGDNELTGIAIGRQCGIVSGDCLLATVESQQLVWQDPDKEGSLQARKAEDSDCQLALTCAAWHHLSEREPALLQKLWPRCVVFGRMKPDDKVNVVKYFQRQGLVVGMAGDGGNDCGGLRAAHAGIALSSAEASLVAPFSTGRLEGHGVNGRSGQISLLTIPDLIREGRACLATNLATFTYFIVQAISISGMNLTILVDNNVTVGEWMWLTKDIGLGMVMTFFMTRSRALPYLASIRPTASLLGARTVCTITVQVLLNWLFFFCAFRMLKSQPWYDPLNPVFDISIAPHLWMLKGDNYDGALCSLFWLTSLATVSYVNTYGGNFRRSVCLNWGINASYLSVLFLVAFITLSAPNLLNCLYRVNCDTPNSLACKSLPLLDELSVGGVGECFLGPQVKYWQNHTRPHLPLADGDSPWLPSPDTDCLPPKAMLEQLPLDHPIISTGKGFNVGACVGPNNCFGEAFKWKLLGLLALLASLHHFVMKFVFLGPVAQRLQSSKSRFRRSEDAEAAQGDGLFSPVYPEEPRGEEPEPAKKIQKEPQR